MNDGRTFLSYILEKSTNIIMVYYNYAVSFEMNPVAKAA